MSASAMRARGTRRIHRARRGLCIAGFGAMIALAGSIARASDDAVGAFTLDEDAQTVAPSDETPTSQPSEFKNMSLDELMNIQVTTVTRSPERVAESASAVQVITGEEIRRSGALVLPEALRLAPNLQVAQLNAHDWAITARGFNGGPSANNAFADKLLVMIDGRSVYTPLFGGVFWDVQNVLLEDVDRIEVVSGPGGTLWGANAVNGVINIVTKSARDTQGLYLMGAGGSFWQDYGAVRYGGKISNDLYYRVYGFGFQHARTEFASGLSGNDNWKYNQGGFRTDYYPNDDNTFTFQGDIYGGNEGNSLGPTATAQGSAYAITDGGNLLGRWTHTFSPSSDMSLQMYFDNASRHLPNPDYGYVERTFDVDFQHRFPLGDRQTITWGLGYRLVGDNEQNSVVLSYSPENRTLQLYSGFVQDEIEIVPDEVKFTIGTKLEHNDYSGFELQPSARLAWTPTERQTVWGAISRAVRSPSRFDQDEMLSNELSTPGDFESEKLLAYEVGYRVRPITPLSLSLAGFYNQYSDLRSIDANLTPPPALIFSNDQAAESWGLELSGDLQAAPWWHVRGGYTYFERDIWPTDPTVYPGAADFESSDPHSQVVLQSMMDVTKNIQFDLTGRYVGAVAAQNDPSYVTMDARLAWHYRLMEAAIVGQNLLDNQHPEFGQLQIPRSVYASLTFRW